MPHIQLFIIRCVPSAVILLLCSFLGSLLQLVLVRDLLEDDKDALRSMEEIGGNTENDMETLKRSSPPCQRGRYPNAASLVAMECSNLTHLSDVLHLPRKRSYAHSSFDSLRRSISVRRQLLEIRMGVLYKH